MTLKLQLFLEKIIQYCGQAISWLTLFMVIITFLIVILRYAFDTGWIAMQESVTYLHAINFMMGAAFTLQKDKHVRVDIFYHSFSEKHKALVDIFGTLLLLFPVSGFILWVSWDYVHASWSIRESSGEAGGLPWLYILKSLLLIMPLLMMIQGTAWILKILPIAMGRKPIPQQTES
jgi:TRAP-type mannitol/chloroaromatic compound transport system permease small subunit